MKRITKYINITIGIISFCLINTVMAQDVIPEKDLPLGYTTPSLTEIVPAKIIPAKNLDSIIQLDEKIRQNSKSDFPHRIGYQNKVDANIMSSDLWKKVEKDSIVLFSLKIDGAKAVYMLFDKFWLPNGSKLFIYNKQKTHFVGPYNHANNNGSRTQLEGFCSGIVAGDEIIVEYHPPVRSNLQAIISLESIINVYKPPRFMINEIKEYFQAKSYEYSGYGDFLLSGDCQVNVNCSPEGDNWQDEKKSVVLILRSDGRHCTGFLINNTKSDNTPYLLTAYHCLDGDNPSLFNFYFFYECDTSICPRPEWGDDEPDAIELTNGATLIAYDNNHEDNLDFALLELNRDPKTVLSDDSIYYAGWDRTNNQTYGGVGIYHPQGDVKMISSVDSSGNYPDDTNCNTYYGEWHWGVKWKATTNNHSIIESGSSGSPLYNPDSKVIGVLRSSCSDTYTCDYYPGAQEAVYTKIYNLWNHGTQQDERLKDWLDPLGNNPKALDGRYAGASPVNPCKYDNDTTTIENTTITSDKTYTTQCSYTIRNTTIDNNASVTVNHQWETMIEKDFEIKAGCTFEINAQ
jgi:hypothetical protein